jgi:hypothetical protein
MQAGPESFDQELFDEANERQMKQLVGSVYAAPPMRAEFVDRLSRELDEQFAMLFPATNGERAAVIPLAGETVTRRSSLRIIGSVAAAAVLLVAVAFWGNRPAYGWAAMLEALESCDWVQAITRTSTENGERAAIGWFSQSAKVAAREEGEARVYLNFNSNTSESFDPNEQVVRQQPLKNDGRLGSEFLTLLLASPDGDSLDKKSSSNGYEVIDEKVRKVSGDSGKHLELQVSLRCSESGEVSHLEFSVDPETKLPVIGKVFRDGVSRDSRDDAKQVVQSIEFSYPRQGPGSIYALGVPQAVKVVTVKSVGGARVNSKPTEVDGKPAAAALAGVERPTAAVVVEELVVAGGPNEPTAQPTAEAQGESAAGEVATINTKPPLEVARADMKTKAAAPLPKPLAAAELVEQLNTLLADFWNAQGITPAEPASDTEFLRRVYLDLTGRIPMVSEVYAFLDDPSPDRRENLVDDLLSRRDHATHLAAVWRSILLPEGVDLNTYGGTNKFDRWLADRFDENLPYDEIVRQLLLAEGRVSESGPILFYASLKLNPEEIAAKASRVFLGTRMECAQCHDHPFDDRIAQTDFWGFAAHFAQISRPQGKMEMTSPVLRVHDNNFGEVMLPDTETVVPPRLPDAYEEATTDPTGMSRSRRQQLVDWLTHENNDEFSRAAVNRVWQQVFGRGLIDPVDDMRPANQPLCPEVLDLLTRDFAASGFDLRRLLRALVLTDAYQLSSGTPQDDPSQALCFARMNMKYFTADQLFDCIAVATRNEAMVGSAPDGAIARTENMSRQQFIEQFRVAAGDRTDYQAGVPQALTLMHGTVVHGATDLTSSGLLKSLNAPFFTDEQRLDTLFLATLSRNPTDAEREKLVTYLQDAKDTNERLGILGDVLWALLNSAEFTFIH